MSTLELNGLILSVEFALLAWGILFILMRRQRRSQQTDHAHADAALDEMKTGEPSRREALSTLFESTYGIAGDELTAKVDEYVNREQAFYTAMMRLYLERDGEKLKDLPNELTKVLSPWVTLTQSGMVPASELDDLETAKITLATELQNTKRTLDDLMAEYTAAFHKMGPPVIAPPAPPSLQIERTPEDEVTTDIVFAEEEIELDMDEAMDAPERDEPVVSPVVSAPTSTPEQVPELAADEKSTSAPADVEPEAQSADEPLLYDIEEDGDPILETISPLLPFKEKRAPGELEGLADLFDTPPPAKK